VAAVQSRQAEIGSGYAGFQAIAFDSAAGERMVAEAVIAAIDFGFGTRRATRQLQQRLGADRQFAGDFAARADEITRGCAVGLVGCGYFDCFWSKTGQLSLCSSNKVRLAAALPVLMIRICGFGA